MKIANDFGKHCARASPLIRLQAALKKETPVKVFSCEFCEIFKNTFLRKPPLDCFWIEYKYNDTKMKRMNMKRNYILPHFIHFKKSFFYRASPVAASRHLHYFLSLLFLAFSISPFTSSHRKCSIKKLFLKF